MSEFSSICSAKREVCEARQKLIVGLERRDLIVAALASELFLQIVRRTKIVETNHAFAEVLKGADADCDGVDCLVINGLVKESLKF